MMHDSDTDLVTILLDLIGFFNSPRQDDALLKAASVQLDRALFPLLLRIGTMGPLNVAELAELVGRDPSTVSRQVAKLEGWRLVERVGGEDRRTRAAGITAKGRRTVDALAAAREAMLETALAGWSAKDRETLARLNRRFVDGLKVGVSPPGAR